jgi:alpha-mannosidase
VPLLEPAETSLAEGQFRARRARRHPRAATGKWPSRPYPASTLVAAGGVALLLEHVTEYELLDGELR